MPLYVQHECIPPVLLKDDEKYHVFVCPICEASWHWRPSITLVQDHFTWLWGKPKKVETTVHGDWVRDTSGKVQPVYDTPETAAEKARDARRIFDQLTALSREVPDDKEPR